MTETVSSADANLILLEGIESFQKHAKKIVQQASREVIILSHRLDVPLYADAQFIDLLSAFVRSDRRANVKILVQDIKPVIELNHNLLKLTKRLPSKILLRELTIPPQNVTQAYLIADKNKLLYKHEDDHYAGFANYKAAPECNRICEEFTYLWEQYAKAPPDLQQLYI